MVSFNNTLAYCSIQKHHKSNIQICAFDIGTSTSRILLNHRLNFLDYSKLYIIKRKSDLHFKNDVRHTFCHMIVVIRIEGYCRNVLTAVNNRVVKHVDYRQRLRNVGFKLVKPLK